MVISDYLPIMTERIRKDFNPVRIILFGSAARGQIDSNSDIDLLVVLPKVDNKRRASVAIRRILSDLPVSKDIFVTTPDEIEKRGNLVGDILKSALSEGKVVYERS
jgi:predicted nucleotidyltransferase